jgi:hypothetical protein
MRQECYGVCVEGDVELPADRQLIMCPFTPSADSSTHSCRHVQQWRTAKSHAQMGFVAVLVIESVLFIRRAQALYNTAGITPTQVSKMRQSGTHSLYTHAVFFVGSK